MSALEDAQIPGQLTVDDCIREAENSKGISDSRTDEQGSSSEAPVFTNVTPSGIEVAYSPSPRRHYKVRQAPTYENRGEVFWEEVPSVTSVLGCLEKPGLPYWGNKIGADGVLELVRRGLLKWVA